MARSSETARRTFGKSAGSLRGGDLGPTVHRPGSGRTAQHSVRFVRRLIAERRIEFVKVGRHVRIRESALIAFVVAGTVPPMTTFDATRRAA
ncbi:helix-turn-helix domain-containing protein [Nonomuraea sp. NPDC001023]|uniref:helix-turn-helix domain-containing protein n=1 Tax=unclassified Nonomuraea TaxID=2593643 RepID=UPI00331CE614